MRWSNVVYPTLTQCQREYILGAVLGDDSMVLPEASLNAYLRATQSVAHTSYLVWKYEIMKNHTLQPPKPVSSRRGDRVHHGIRFHTRVTPELTALYRLCYPKGKKTVSQTWLDQLTAFSLAVWYMDDGTYAPGRDFCMLYTGAFPYSQQLLLRNYLRARWRVTDFVIQRNRQQWCLRFTRRGTQQLLEIIDPHVQPVPGMLYKLGGAGRPWKRSINPAMDRHHNAWKKTEDRLLERRYGHVPAIDLAQQLGRTRNAVCLRANKLGLNGWQPDRVSDGQGAYHISNN